MLRGTSPFDRLGDGLWRVHFYLAQGPPVGGVKTVDRRPWLVCREVRVIRAMVDCVHRVPFRIRRVRPTSRAILLERWRNWWGNGEI